MQQSAPRFDWRLDWYRFLGRPPLPAAAPPALEALRGRRLLVTGAGGSIGSALTMRLAALRPSNLALLELSENNLHDLSESLRERGMGGPVANYLGSVTDPELLEEIFDREQPELVFHAAAHKHVPLLESHPLAALANNVIGTLEVAEQARKRGSRLVLLSTDKAASPASVMGASKRLAELIVLAHGGTALRLGNVLASRGSVVENFAHQIARGGPVTVTHPEARRYFLALEESVELLLSAACEGGSGVAGASLLTPVLHQTHLVGDLAAFMGSELSPNLSIPVVYSGLQPGEKLEEELWSVEEFPAAATGNGLRKVETPQPSRAELDAGLREMRAAIEGRDVADAIGLLRGLVPNYSPSKSVMKLVRQSRDKAPA